MNKRRIEALKQDIYNFVFAMVDDEPEMSGFDAGYLATKASEEFEKNALEICGYSDYQHKPFGANRLG